MTTLAGTGTYGSDDGGFAVATFITPYGIGVSADSMQVLVTDSGTRCCLAAATPALVMTRIS